jgi:DNA-binding CsgD family transcriptional regulator
VANELEQTASAGYEAMAAGRWSIARELFDEVLASDEVPAVLLGRGAASYWLGDLDAMIDSYERAYRAALKLSDWGLAVGAAMALVGYQKQFVGNEAVARGWLSRAARLIDTHSLPLQGHLYGPMSYRADDPVDSERLARLAVENGRAGGEPDLELHAMTAVGAALVQQGQVEEGMTLLDEAMAAAIGGECGDPLTVAHMSCMTIDVCNSYFDIVRATQWLDAMDRFIDRYGCPFLYAECRTNYGRVLFENGDWANAERFLGETLAMTRGVTPASRAQACGVLAEMRIAQGRLEEAERLLAGQEGHRVSLAARATLHMARGEPEAAESILRRHVDSAGARRLDSAVFVDLLGQAEIALGHTDRAEARARQLVGLGQTHACALIAAHGERLLGLALAAVDTKAAVEHLEVALDAFIQAETPYRSAEVRLAIARVMRVDLPEVAVVESRAALSVFEDLGAARDVDATVAVLRQLGVRAARSGPRNLGRLTRREQEVLDLLGVGLSNPEIAKRLFVSRKTVEHHVARVLAKLDVRGRAEAAAIAADAATIRRGDRENR